MRPSKAIVATAFASILFSASASRADVPPPPDSPPPYSLPPAQVARPGCQPTWDDPCRFTYSLPPVLVAPPVLAAPKTLKWNEGEMIPPGYRVATMSRTGLVIGGSVTFGTAWVPSAILGSFGPYQLAIPVVGPFLLASAGPAHGGGEIFIGLLVLDGIQQAAGIAMFIAGLTAPKTVLLRADIKAAKRWWLPTPMSFGKGSGGLGIMGTM